MLYPVVNFSFKMCIFICLFYIAEKDDLNKIHCFSDEKSFELVQESWGWKLTGRAAIRRPTRLGPNILRLSSGGGAK